MKKFIVWTLAVMLIITEVLFPIHIHADETTDQCEEMAFAVEVPVVGDEKLTGEGQTGQKIELIFNDLETIIEVEEDGRFEYEWEDELPEEDDIIMLKNGSYEIELIIKEEKTETDMIEAELIGVCEAEIPPEEIQKEEPVKEETEKDEQFEVEEESSDDPVEEADDIVEEISEESAEEATELDEENADETSIEDNAEEDSEEKESEAAEVAADDVADDLSDEMEPVEEVEEKEFEEIISKENEAPEDSDNQEESTREGTEEVESKDKSSEEKLPEESSEIDEGTDVFDEEITEKVEETEEDKTTEAVVDGETDVKNERSEIFSDFKHEIAPSEKSEVSIKSIRGDTAWVSTPTEFNDALSSRSVERIILEADVRQPIPNEVHSDSGQKIIDTEGYDIDLVNSTMFLHGSITEMIIRNTNNSDRKTNLFTSSNGENDGFIKKVDTAVTLHLENINFNLHSNPSGGKFGSNWEGEVHLYGDNVMNTFNSRNAFAFRKIFIHDHSRLKLHHQSNNPAFMFNQDDTSSGQYGFEIGAYATVEIQSNGAVVETGRLRNNSFNFNVGQRADVNLVGSNSVVFDLYTEIDFNINNPERVDFNNIQRNGRLFPVNGGLVHGWLRNNDVNFFVENAELKGWNSGNKTETPSSSTDLIEKGHFTFTTIWILAFIERTDVTSMTPHINRFSNNFPPSVGRLVFERSIPGVLKFGSSPGNMIFETTEIKDEEQIIKRASPDYSFEVVDTRKNGNWKLTAEVLNSLSYGNSDIMSDVIHFFEEDGSSVSIEQGPVKVASKNMNDRNPTQQVSWGSDEGVLLKLNPIHAEADKEYTATISWTLSDGP